VSTRPDDAAALADFFARLADDPALYNDYITDPVATMRAASIPEDIIAAVLQGNLRKLNKLFASREDAGGPVVILGTIVRG
jgi:hypothetical protein